MLAPLNYRLQLKTENKSVFCVMGKAIMTETELNNYIKHYLEEDKTHTAIMLTGEWGSGKTYYVENVLAPFLKNDNDKNRCIIISLYGLENISDINKSIYMELRMKGLEKNSEATATGKLIAKTIEYSCAVTPQIRQTGNRLSGLAGTAYASLLA